MKAILMLIMLTLGTTVFAQNQKINFEPVSLSDALKKAKATNKLVFVDCYTEWCIPCKQMEATVFKTDSVAAFFNSKLVNLQIDMEKGEGPEVLKTYNIGAFPSYLLIDGDGKVLYKFVGGMPAEEFMVHIRKGMKADNEEARMLARYAAGERQPDLLRALVLLKLRIMEIEVGKHINGELMDLLTPEQRALPENWVLFEENRYAMYLSNVDTRNFNYLADNWRDFAATNHKDSVDKKMSHIFRKLASECLDGYHFKNTPYHKADFERYKAQITATEMPDKNQLLVLIEMAQAAGEKDYKRVTSLFEKNIPTFSEDNLRITWPYVSMCSLIPGYKYPRAKEIANKVIKQTKNPYLVSTCEMLKEQQVRANKPVKEDQSK
ncbi:thioredoxin family protein [Pedobacter sp. AW31-3R]|uniref:thioredoxin family protein n=1 Tax=Pedobacter sp. AW31-3R TaxID=3445781 RepID=UPI003FA0CDD8